MIVHSKNIILNGWEGHILRSDRWKSKAKLEKCHFPENKGQLFQFCPGRLETPFSHILDPNYPYFYLKCPRKYQRTYNFENFSNTSPNLHLTPLKFLGKSQILLQLLMCT